MNYDRNGVLVTTSQAKPALRKCTRVVTVDSRDRDPTKFVRVAGEAEPLEAFIGGAGGFRR